MGCSECRLHTLDEHWECSTVTVEQSWAKCILIADYKVRLQRNYNIIANPITNYFFQSLIVYLVTLK